MKAEVVDTSDGIVKEVGLKDCKPINGVSGEDNFYFSCGDDIFILWTMEGDAFNCAVELEVFNRHTDESIFLRTYECEGCKMFSCEGNIVKSDCGNLMLEFSSEGKLINCIVKGDFSVV